MNLQDFITANEKPPFGADSIHNLSQLLENIGRLLRSTASSASPSAEDVHQLRVACRRTEVALQLLSRVAQIHERKSLTRNLKRLRRSANGLRDHDILIERFRCCGGNHTAQSFLHRLEEHRSHCQPTFQTFARKLAKQWELERSIARIPEQFASSAETQPDVSVACLAAAETQLQSFASRFCKAASKPLRKAPSLHRLRIRTKQMRYAIEILGGDLNEETALDARLQLETLQDELGGLNDHHTSERLIRRWRAQTTNAGERRFLKELALEEQKAYQTSRKKFRKGWTGHRSKQLRRTMKKLSKSISKR